VDALRAAGIKVDDNAAVPGLREGHDVSQRLIQGAVSVAIPDDDYEQLRNRVAAASADDDSGALRWARNITQSARDMGFGTEQRMQLAARWAEFFRSYDALLWPVMPTPAFPHDHNPDVDART